MGAISPTVLVVGDTWRGSNALSMVNGFAALGLPVFSVDTTAISRPRRGSRSWWTRKRTGNAHPRDVARTMADVREACDAINPDIVLCIKTIHLDQAALLELRSPIKIHYSADDVSNPYNTTPAYLRHESEWDHIFTTKSFNVAELENRGCDSAHYVWSAYDPSWHFRAPQRRLRKFSVGFIGNSRPDRVGLIRRLARKHGSEMYVAGPGWRRDTAIRSSGAVVRVGQYGAEFAEAVADTTANLVLLNSENRDLHTCRSFEVPASGGLVVAQRTEEHLELLDEGNEALYFSTAQELDEVLARVARDPHWADSVALNGYRAITEGEKHTYKARARAMLGVVG